MFSPQRAPEGFATVLGLASERQAGRRPKILVVEFGGLGDHVHSLPALKLLRDNLPEADITMMVGGGGAAVFRDLVPWIDHVWIYDREGLAADYNWMRRIRAAHFDAAIQLMQSNRGTWFIALSGAPLRLVRRNDENKPWRWQPWLLTHVAEQPYHQIPKYRQRWRSLQAAGFKGAEPTSLSTVGAVVDTTLRRSRGILADDDGHYLHCSASASDDARDLPASQMIELWNRLRQRFPDYRLIMSTANTPRARQRLDTLLAGIAFTPWKIFAGDIDVPTFSSVMQGAALHLGPDSGGLHIARLVGTPSVSWFRPNHHLANWLPDEAGHLAFVAPESRAEGLLGIETTVLLDAVASLLADRSPN